MIRPVRSLRVTRAARQLLHRPSGFGPPEVVERLLAVQSQDLIQGRRALRARGEGFSAAGVDAALVEERSVVVTWLNRTTIHMTTRDDYPWLHGLTAPTHATQIRRGLEREGVEDPDRAVKTLARALESGPLTRRELRARLTSKGIHAKGQAFAYELSAAAMRGLVVIGPQGVALTRDWLGIDPPRPPEGEARERALAELARRYLAGHGPATDRDLAWWAGLPLRDARAGLAAIAKQLAEPDGELVDLKKPPRLNAPERMPLRLLPTWDAYLLGWKERDFLVAGGHAPRIYVGGMIGPAIVLDGMVAGTFKARRDGKRLAVETEAFKRLPARALQAELEDLARFEGAELKS
ncbi:MAG TPA: winged helix DNA-binding domain-containing protein [Thermoleophilaceae bacterium]|jgi:hypothetical protein|nr:winged helix DNA-binding domain-containing protein [Thermoleophilaceae bacterium]